MDGKEIGALIKKKREDKGFAMQDVADKVGTSRQNIRRYEIWDLKKPDRDLLESILLFLEINPSIYLSKPFMAVSDNSISSTTPVADQNDMNAVLEENRLLKEELLELNREYRRLIKESK